MKEIRRRDRYLWVQYELLEIEGITGSDLLVYMALARFANNESQSCYPSYQTICETAHVKRATVSKCLKHLEELGAIHINRTANKVNNYTLLTIENKGGSKNELVQMGNCGGSNGELRVVQMGNWNNTNITKPNNNTNNITKKPNNDNNNFFTSYQEIKETVIPYLVNKGINMQIASSELDAFYSYWTEPNHSGTKQRWQMEKTFDVKRRLATWFRNYEKFNKGYNKENKGIRI